MTLKVLTKQYVAEAQRLDRERRSEKKLRPVEGYPFWPHEMARNTVILCFFTAGILYLSAFMPYFLELPANPAGQPEVILPDWYLLWSYGFLKWGNDLQILNGPDGAWVTEPWHVWDRHWWTPWNMGPETGIVHVPIVGPLNAKSMGLIGNHTPILLFLFVLPFIDRGKAQRPQEQPFMTAIGVFGILLMFTVSVYSVNTIVYDRWPVFAKPILEAQLAWLFQFEQWDLLSWLTGLVPILGAIISYVAVKSWRDKMMTKGDRVFKLNRNYHVVR